MADGAPKPGRGAQPRWNLLLLLRITYDEIETAMIDRLHESGFPEIRAAHGQVFATIAAEGSRIGEMARRAGITQQSMGELVDALERLGYLERQPDPADRRARLIRLTDRGLSVAQAANNIVEEIEHQWAQRIGKTRAAAMRAGLEQIATDAHQR